MHRITAVLLTLMFFDPYIFAQSSSKYIIDVGAFGAVCDGSHDDTTAITNALNLAQNTSPNGIRTVGFPAD